MTITTPPTLSAPGFVKANVRTVTNELSITKPAAWGELGHHAG